MDAASVTARRSKATAPAAACAAVLATTTAATASQQGAESHHAINVVGYLLLHYVHLNPELVHFALRSP